MRAPGQRQRLRGNVYLVLAVFLGLLAFGAFAQEPRPTAGDVVGGIICLVLAAVLVLRVRHHWRAAAAASAAARQRTPPRPVAVAPAPVAPPPPALSPLLPIWRELRPDALGPAPHDRYAAWAQAIGEHVELQLLRCAPTAVPLQDAVPPPLERRTVSIIDPESIEDAASAMEALREDAARREEQARIAQAEAASAAEQAEYEAALREVDEAAARYQREREQAMLRELAAEEAQDRRAQAEAVAEALRRP